jgi:hypothetical protein
MNSNHRYFTMLQASLVADPEVMERLDAKRSQHRREMRRAWEDYYARGNRLWARVWRDFGIIAAILLVGYLLACHFLPGSKAEDISGFLLPMLPAMHLLFRGSQINVPYPEIIDKYRSEAWFTVCPAGSPARQHADELCERHVECRTYRDAVLEKGRNLRVADVNYIEELAVVIERGDAPEPSDWPNAVQPN